MDDKLFLLEVGKRIKRYRKSKNLSQQFVARSCNIEKSNISRLESGKGNPTIATLRKVCVALDTSIHDLTKDVEVGQSSFFSSSFSHY